MDAAPLDNLLGKGSMPFPPPPDPMPLFVQWFEDAHRAAAVPNPNAMVLATATRDGAPSARVVLCKAIDAKQPALIFHTNYESRKGEELRANARCAAVFHWDHAQRQARVEGVVSVLPAAESDAYFRTRPLLSQLGAWASVQSRPMEKPGDLVSRVAEMAKKFGVPAADLVTGSTGVAVPRPANWGGFRIDIERLELWSGGAGRLHERTAWTRQGGAWRGERLYP